MTLYLGIFLRLNVRKVSCRLIIPKPTSKKTTHKHSKKGYFMYTFVCKAIIVSLGPLFHTGKVINV